MGSAPPAANLGWLGNDERYTTGASLDLIQMGVRLYDPALGRFLEPDPAPGGSANAYDYCFQDPVNCFDLAGTFSFGHFLKGLHKVLSPIVATLQVASALGAVFNVIPGLEFVGVAIDVATVALSTVNALAECASGDVKAGGCAVLAIGAAVEALGAGVGRSLEDLELPDLAGKIAPALAKEATFVLSQGLEKVGHLRGR